MHLVYCNPDVLYVERGGHRGRAAYNRRSSPGYAYRAPPQDYGRDDSARCYACAACRIADSRGTGYCVGAYGGCPVAINADR
jgi:hypothetical protein